MALGEPDFEADVAAVYQSERRQRILEERCLRFDGIRRVDAQPADQREISGILRRCRSCGTKPECERGGDAFHSMTSSARPRIESGMVMPSESAVFRLITNANLVGFWTGSSLALAPFANFGEYEVACRGLPIVILIGRCVGELLPWSSPENIGRSF
jgi:hypothetical protein